MVNSNQIPKVTASRRVCLNLETQAGLEFVPVGRIKASRYL